MGLIPEQSVTFAPSFFSSPFFHFIVRVPCMKFDLPEGATYSSEDIFHKFVWDIVRCIS